MPAMHDSRAGRSRNPTVLMRSSSPSSAAQACARSLRSAPTVTTRKIAARESGASMLCASIGTLSQFFSALPGLLSPPRSLRRLIPRQFRERGLEILGFAEITIDRRETHISDVVELAQMRHYGFADGLRRDFALAHAFQLAHDFRHHLVDPFGLDRALAAGDLHRSQKLVAIERHAPAVALDHGELAQLHALEGGEAEIAGEADAAAADDRRILRRPRILDLGIEASAARTAHVLPLDPHLVRWDRIAFNPFAHDPFGKPVPTLPDHALPLVDREPADQTCYFLAYARFHERVFVGAFLA